MEAFTLRDFMAESLRIEGIERAPSDREIQATEWFLGLEIPTVTELRSLVDIYQPGAILRDAIGLNVYVGNHHPLPGGPDVVTVLEAILASKFAHPYHTHQQYEALHPFTDGNGRSGRALWLWGMQKLNGGPGAAPLGFLHHWYYQSLEFGGRR